MHGVSGWQVLRSMGRDRSTAAQKLAPGTVRRILGFARPYARLLIALVVLLAVGAGLGALTPLIFREIINEGVLGKDARLVVLLACLVAAIAVASAVVGLAERWCSSRLGDGLIFDMRSRVFAHIQRMPIAFFARTQTGALVSRLNS